MTYTCEWLPKWSGYLLVVKKDGMEFSKLLSSKDSVPSSLKEADKYFSNKGKHK